MPMILADVFYDTKVKSTNQPFRLLPLPLLLLPLPLFPPIELFLLYPL